MTSTFIGDFHSLSGTTIDEKRRNLYQLLIKNKSNSNEINFDAIKPLTHLEEVFKTETLIFFKKTNQLMPILQSENLTLIKKVLLNEWFVREAFGNLSGDEFVNEILANISYRAKIQVLKKISLHLSTEKSEEFYKAIQNAYDLSLACKLLPSCSGVFILRQMEKNKISFSPRQLWTVISKNPECVESLLEKIHKQNEKVAIGKKYAHTFKHLIFFHSGLFLKLHEAYIPDIQLGARATKNFLIQQTEHVVKNSKKFSNILFKKQIPKSLKENFEQFYRNLLPKSLSDFQTDLDDYLSFLEHAPNSQKVKILTDSFRTVYGDEIWKQPNLITETIIEMMIIEERETFLKNYPKPNTLAEETWISFMKVEKSVPLLKEKILLTSNKTQRLKLICSLIKTCKINKDFEALLEVCKYILKKHRNEEFEIRLDILVCLVESFDWRKMSDKHWVFVRELARLVEVEAFYRPYCLTELLRTDLYRHCEKNLDIDDLFKEGMKKEGVYFLSIFFRDNEQKYEKLYLSTYLKLVNSVFTKENELISAYVDYLYKVKEYNSKTKRDKISYFLQEEPIRYLKIDLEKDSFSYSSNVVLQEVIIKEYDEALECGLVQLYLAKVSYYNPSPTIKFLLDENPKILLNSFEPLIASEYKINGVLEQYKFYEYTNLPQNIASKCLDWIKSKSEEEDVDWKKMERATLILSYTMRAEEFINFITTFCQKESKMVATKYERNVFQIQKYLLDELKFTKFHLKALECIFNYQQEEFHEIVTNNSVAIASQINENVLVDFLQRSSPNRQSVLLTQLFFAKKAFKGSLTLFMKRNDVSLQKYYFKAAIKFFVRNPDDVAWNLLKSLLQTLSEEDSDVYAILTKFKEIPNDYFVPYVTFTWNALESIKNAEKSTKGAKSKFLEAIDAKNITSLPKSFCLDVIKGHFLQCKELKDKDKFQKNVHIFVCNYLIYHPSVDAPGERVRPIFSILKKYVLTTWYDLKTLTSGREIVFGFVKRFCSNFLDKKHENDPILEAFLSAWLKTFGSYEAFDECLYIRFTSMYVNCLNNNSSMEELGRNLGQLCIKLDANGSMNVQIFCRTLESFKEKFVSLDEDGEVNENYLKIVQGLLGCGSAPFLFNVALFLLPDVDAITSKVKEEIEEIVDKILLLEDPSVQIHVNHYLDQNKSDMYWCSL